jgi:hypothetical protein
MNTLSLKSDLLTILKRHRGAASAIQVCDLTVMLGFELTDSNERIVRQLKRDLVDEGHLIASSCGKQPGYFIPVTAEEINEPLRNYTARLKSLAVLIASIEGTAALRGLWGQLELELGEK